MNDLSKKKDQELLDLLLEKKHAIRDMNFSLSKSKPGEKSIASVKKEIAQILTEINARKNQALEA